MPLERPVELPVLGFRNVEDQKYEDDRKKEQEVLGNEVTYRLPMRKLVARVITFHTIDHVMHCFYNWAEGESNMDTAISEVVSGGQTYMVPMHPDELNKLIKRVGYYERDKEVTTVR